MPETILAIDQGTTGSTALILDRNLQLLGKGYQEFEQVYPKPGWVEHDPEAIWNSVRAAVTGALENAGIEGSDLAGIGITNQRETVAIWERASHKAVRNAIVWQCRRTAEICNRLKKAGYESTFREKTGLVLDPYFSGTKIHWMLKEDPSLVARAKAGELAAGTVDSYLVYRLTDGAAHVTDVSNASRTLLLDIHTMKWDSNLLDILEIPAELLPEVVDCSGVYGKTRGLDFLPDGIPVAGMAGDQQAALFGQACFAPGEAKCTYGTGAFLLMNTGERAVPSPSQLLTTVAWRLDGKVTYALEGSAFIAGAAVQWLRDELKLIDSAPEIEALAETVDSSDGVVFVPAFAGLGAPHWRPEARGVIHGLTRGSNRGHIARAVLEGIALQNFEILDAMEKDSGIDLKALKVDGGAAANNLLMQFQADILNRRIVRPQMLETTALGAAFLAGLGVGLWQDQEDIRRAWKMDREFSAQMDQEERTRRRQLWREVVAKA